MYYSSQCEKYRANNCILQCLLLTLGSTGTLIILSTCFEGVKATSSSCLSECLRMSSSGSSIASGIVQPPHQYSVSSELELENTIQCSTVKLEISRCSINKPVGPYLNVTVKSTVCFKINWLITPTSMIALLYSLRVCAVLSIKKNHYHNSDNVGVYTIVHTNRPQRD